MKKRKKSIWSLEALKELAKHDGLECIPKVCRKCKLVVINKLGEVDCPYVALDFLSFQHMSGFPLPVSYTHLTLPTN